MYAVMFRNYYEKCTIGVIELFSDSGDLLYSCSSLELPNKNNERKISCIPEGNYDVAVVSASPKIRYKHFHVLNVSKRDGIKIHVANYVKQLMGCIAPGTMAIDMNGDGIIDVANSTAALNQLLEIAEKQGYTAKNKKTFKLCICS